MRCSTRKEDDRSSREKMFIIYRSEMIDNDGGMLLPFLIIGFNWINCGALCKSMQIAAGLFLLLHLSIVWNCYQLWIVVVITVQLGSYFSAVYRFNWFIRLIYSGFFFFFVEDVDAIQPIRISRTGLVGMKPDRLIGW